MPIWNVNGFVEVLDQFLETFLGDQNLVGPENAHDIQAVTVMPNNSSEISLSQLKVGVDILPCDNTNDSSFIINMIVVSFSNEFRLSLT